MIRDIFLRQNMVTIKNRRVFLNTVLRIRVRYTGNRVTQVTTTYSDPGSEYRARSLEFYLPIIRRQSSRSSTDAYAHSHSSSLRSFIIVILFFFFFLLLIHLIGLVVCAPDGRFEQ